MRDQNFATAAKALPSAIRRWFIGLLMLTVFGGASVAWAQSAPPIIFFTDLDSAPNSGGESVSGFSGAYVTLYGNFFGATQGASTVTFNGANCLRVVSWGVAWQWYQRTVVQLGSSCPVGSGNFVVTVNGQASNGVPFTVRSLGSNHIYFTATSGSDSNAGTFASPLRTIVGCKNKLNPGDICYIMGGVVQSAQDNFGAALDVEASGSAGLPLALGSYPGATPQPSVNAAAGVQYGIRVPNIGISPTYWTFFGIQVVEGGGDRGFNIRGSNWRVTGINLQCPNFNAQAGCFEADQADHVYFYGNEVTNTGMAGGSQKMAHAVYFSTDSNSIWAAWNHIHDNTTCRCMQFHSSPLGGSTGQDQYDLHVHDNMLHGDFCDGINFATVDPSKGTVEAYNNLIYHVGTHLSSDGGGDFSCIVNPAIVNTGSTPPATPPIQVYNNTCYDVGSVGSADTNGVHGAIGNTTPPNMLLNNNIFQQLSGELYLQTAGTRATGLSGSTNDWFGVGSPPSMFTSSLNVDAQFVSPGSDFHLQSTSPMIGKGITSWSGGTSPVYDIEGKPRSNPPSVGAFEFSAGSVVQRPNPPTNLSVTVQ